MTEQASAYIRGQLYAMEIIRRNVARTCDIHGVEDATLALDDMKYTINRAMNAVEVIAQPPTAGRHSGRLRRWIS